MSFEEFDKEIKFLIMEMMMVLYRYGIDEIHLGGLLRVLGVSNEVAAESDEDAIIINEQFAKYIESMAELETADFENKTIH